MNSSTALPVGSWEWVSLVLAGLLKAVTYFIVYGKSFAVGMRCTCTASLDVNIAKNCMLFIMFSLMLLTLDPIIYYFCGWRTVYCTFRLMLFLYMSDSQYKGALRFYEWAMAPLVAAHHERIVKQCIHIGNATQDKVALAKLLKSASPRVFKNSSNSHYSATDGTDDESIDLDVEEIDSAEEEVDEVPEFADTTSAPYRGTGRTVSPSPSTPSLDPIVPPLPLVPSPPQERSSSTKLMRPVRPLLTPPGAWNFPRDMLHPSFRPRSEMRVSPVTTVNRASREPFLSDDDDDDAPVLHY